MAYIGNVPAEKYASLTRQTFSSPTGTSHTLSHTVTNSDDLLLYINNVKQDPADYTASGTSLTTPTLVSGDEMYALFYGRATETVNPPDDSVGLSQMASGTDGNLITFDASGNPAYVATGNDGQVLTSAGAGQPCLFEDAAGGGAWTYISSATASTSSSLDFTSGIDSTYDVYMFYGSSIVLSADVTVNIRVGGGSFDSGASDYKFSVTRQSVGGWNQASDAAHTSMDMGHAQYSGGGTSEATHFRILLYSPSDTTHYKVIEAHQSGQDSSASPQNNMLVGQRDSTSAITRLQVLPSSGTITSGIIRMYGLAKS